MLRANLSQGARVAITMTDLGVHKDMASGCVKGNRDADGRQAA